MKKKITVLTLCAMLFAPCVAAEAQQPKKVPQIGLLGSSGSAESARTDAFRQGLRELGYVEGKNIVIVSRDAGGKPDRQRALAVELVRLKIDVPLRLVREQPVPPRKQLLRFQLSWRRIRDPIGNGFVASLARPGGNITGLSNLGPELSGKRLELLTEVVPRLTRVAVFGTSTFPGNAQILKETELAAGTLRVQLQYLDILDPKDFETSFRGASKGRAEAVLVLAGQVFTSQRTQLADLAVKNRLPAIYYATEFVEDGGLMTYGANRADLARRAATICRQDSQRCQACRSPCGAADEVRVHNQSQSGEADRPDDSAECAGAGGSGS